MKFYLLKNLKSLPIYQLSINKNIVKNIVKNQGSADKNSTSAYSRVHAPDSWTGLDVGLGENEKGRPGWTRSADGEVLRFLLRVNRVQNFPRIILWIKSIIILIRAELTLDFSSKEKKFVAVLFWIMRELQLWYN